MPMVQRGSRCPGGITYKWQEHSEDKLLKPPCVEATPELSPWETSSEVSGNEDTPERRTASTKAWRCHFPVTERWVEVKKEAEPGQESHFTLYYTSKEMERHLRGLKQGSSLISFMYYNRSSKNWFENTFLDFKEKKKNGNFAGLESNV